MTINEIFENPEIVAEFFGLTPEDEVTSVVPYSWANEDTYCIAVKVCFGDESYVDFNQPETDNLGYRPDDELYDNLDFSLSKVEIVEKAKQEEIYDSSELHL